MVRPYTPRGLSEIGFEVRVDAVADGNDVWVQISRGEADRLDLAPGSQIFLRPVMLRPVTGRQEIISAVH